MSRLQCIPKVRCVFRAKLQHETKEVGSERPCIHSYLRCRRQQAADRERAFELSATQRKAKQIQHRATNAPKKWSERGSSLGTRPSIQDTAQKPPSLCGHFSVANSPRSTKLVRALHAHQFDSALSVNCILHSGRCKELSISSIVAKSDEHCSGDDSTLKSDPN